MSKEKGLVIVFTGNGKGKTTASLGMAVRAWGQGMKVLVLQFIKGDKVCGELKLPDKLEGFEIRLMGKGFTNTGDPDEHVQAARNALNAAREEIIGCGWDMVILDEIIYAVGFKLLPEEDLLELIKLKPASMHLVLTGRDAPGSLVDQADLVTEMKEVKHPYSQGIKAQKGIEF